MCVEKPGVSGFIAVMVLYVISALATDAIKESKGFFKVSCAPIFVGVWWFCTSNAVGWTLLSIYADLTDTTQPGILFFPEWLLVISLVPLLCGIIRLYAIATMKFLKKM